MQTAQAQITTQQPAYRLPWKDEADLSWYFGPGAAYFEKSTFGIMLERAILFGQQTEPCERCGTLGFVELTAEEMVARAAKFESLAAARRADDVASDMQSDEEVARLRELRNREHRSICAEATCPECKGRKYVLTRVPLRVGMAFSSTALCTRCMGTRRTASGDPCPRCDAMGYFEPVTVNKAPEGGNEEGWCPDDEALVRYALVSRRLDRMTDSGIEVLQLFYGDRGARWAGTKEGRLLALYHLTPAGAKLAARGITREMRETLGELGLRLDEAVWNECEAQRQRPTATRASQLERSREQAERLLGAASEQWCATGSTEAVTA